MGSADRAALLPLAESIADGSPIDWDAVESRAPAEDQAVIRQLRILADLATLHRTMPARPGALPNTFAARRTATAPAIGTWAHLDLIERIGGGTFGTVYRAWDRHLEREVALKLLRVEEAGDDLQASRIAKEGRLLARVRHANVVTVHGVAVHEGRVGLWMELVHGATLEQILEQTGRFGAREAALIGIDLCRALAAIHSAGLIHRDVKAQNVMREQGGRIVLMDLGTGREIAPAGVEPLPDLAGTPLYLAPEIFSGEPATERTDLFSLGVLLYHLVTGSFPVRAATFDALREAHRQGVRTRLRDARADLPTVFVRVVDRATSVDPAERYASAGALEADLVHALDEAGPAGEPAPTSRGERPPRQTTWRRLALVAALLLLSVIVVTPWFIRFCCKPPLDPRPIRSIAVLPLVNVSGDPSQEYFVDGMTDELISTLGRIASVRVISRTSSMQFKGSRQPLPEIARALRVDAVLEGSVVVSGPLLTDDVTDGRQVRINARLINAGTDTQLWDKTFESVVTDVFALQSQVATAVSEGISSRLTVSPQVATRPVNAKAHDAYLRGLYYANKRTPADLRRAVDDFKAAVDADPTYPLAWAGLAGGYNLIASYDEERPGQARLQAKAAAMKAIELDESSPEAHVVLGDFKFAFEWDIAGAEKEFERALTINPNYAVAHAWYGLFLNEVGRFDQGLIQMKRAQELDPLSLVTEANVSRSYYFARQYDKALEGLLELERREPDFWIAYAIAGQTYLAKGSVQEAIRQLDRARRLSPSTARNLGVLGDAYGRAGRRADALRVLNDLGRMARTRYVPPAYTAMIHMGLGDHHRALDDLDRAFADRSDWIMQLDVEPQFDPLRAEPRFVELLRRAGVTARKP